MQSCCQARRLPALIHHLKVPEVSSKRNKSLFVANPDAMPLEAEIVAMIKYAGAEPDLVAELGA